MNDGVIFVKSDVYQARTGWDWVVSVPVWEVRATGHETRGQDTQEGTIVRCHAAMARQLDEWAKEREAEFDGGLLVLRPNDDMPTGGITN